MVHPDQVRAAITQALPDASVEVEDLTGGGDHLQVKLMPQCGFSNNVVQILNSLAVPFETFDVLSDMEIRQGIKEYSDWPTIPQVYVNGEFIGGSDILIELYNSGELRETLAVALA